MTQSKEVAEELFECYTKTAGNIFMYFKDGESLINDLKDIVKKNCEIDTKLNMIQKIKNEVLKKYDDKKITIKNIPTIIEDYEKAISTMDADLSTNEKLLGFNKQLEALLNEANENQNVEENNSDEELQLTGSMNVIDPISKMRIKDPIKNIACGHTYDRENIMALLKVNKKTRCPIVGCKDNKYIEITNLQTNVAMKAFLQRNPV